MASTGTPHLDPPLRGGRRPSQAVYRRRRLVAVVVLLLLLAGLAVGAATLAGAFGPGERGAEAAAPTSSATDAPAPTPDTTAPPTAASPSSPPPTPSPTAASPSATPTPSADATPAPSATAAGCATAVVVEAETDKPGYAPGEEPVLSLVVKNTGTEACEVNVGTSQMEFVLTSDGERVFSSVDCQADSQDLQQTIEPGGEERATFDWSRTRTVPECTVVDEEPAPGEYTLTTRLGARSSEPVEFTLQE